MERRAHNTQLIYSLPTWPSTVTSSYSSHALPLQDEAEQFSLAPLERTHNMQLIYSLPTWPFQSRLYFPHPSRCILGTGFPPSQVLPSLRLSNFPLSPQQRYRRHLQAIHLYITFDLAVMSLYPGPFNALHPNPTPTEFRFHLSSIHESHQDGITRNFFPLPKRYSSTCSTPRTIAYHLLHHLFLDISPLEYYDVTSHNFLYRLLLYYAYPCCPISFEMAISTFLFGYDDNLGTMQPVVHWVLCNPLNSSLGTM